MFEVYFGDGVLGTALSDGNIVILTYVVTNREDANTTTFTNAAAIDTVVDVQVSTVEPASGGAFPESIDSIKFNAPLDYASQGRCVTAEDYKTFVKRFFPKHSSDFCFWWRKWFFRFIIGSCFNSRVWKSFYIN